MTLSQRAVEAAARAIFAARGWPLAIHPAFEHEQEDWMACAEAALAAYLAALAVDGMCLVPKEPTAKMLGRGAIAQFEAEPNMKVEATWTAMLAAASTGDSPRQREG